MPVGLIYNENPRLFGTHYSSILISSFIQFKNSFPSKSGNARDFIEFLRRNIFASVLNNRILPSVPLKAFVPSKHYIA
jgi:hypothetical protein